MQIQHDLITIPGIGPKTIEALGRLNIFKIQDLLWHFPVNIVNRTLFPAINSIKAGDIVVLKVSIFSHDPIAKNFVSNRKKPFNIYCYNESGKINLTFFNYFPKYILNKKDDDIIVIGKVDFFNGIKQISHPEIIQSSQFLAKQSNCEPIYPLTFSLLNKQIYKYIQFALNNLSIEEEWIDENIINEYSWSSHKASLLEIHSPKSDADLLPNTKARTRIAFDQFLANQLAINLLRRNKTKLGRSVNGNLGVLHNFMNNLPFELTKDQIKSIEEINRDLHSELKMSRLLQGDVGSGKTIVAFCAMLLCATAKCQSVLMVPTDVLANQHYSSFLKFTLNLNLNIQLLTGQTKARERKNILEDLASGKIDILIGTHAVFQDKVMFFDLALVVIDEQHKFGVEQRMKLVNKGENVNLLIMSATPSPRSLSLALYGDLDITRISQKPKSRIPIKTSIIPNSEINELVEKLSKIIEDNGKIYWICPAISKKEESESANIKSKTAAETRYAELAKTYPSVVGLVHGKMESKAKEENLTKFIEGNFKILVATTVIEVGVDVPDATVIIIENAESFGLAQLHQLRGRVGRGAFSSFCILVYKSPISKTAFERLKILREVDDGFILAEEDLKLRGTGNIIGTKQSGLPDFKAADFISHYPLLTMADAQAKNILDEDPNLEFPKNAKFRNLLIRFDLDIDKFLLSRN